MELSQYKLEPLREDEQFILYRGHPRQADVPSILLLAPISAHPSPEILNKLEHEYSLRSKLDATWSVRPLALSQYNEQPVLVLENPGGEPLNRLIQGPMEMAQFLRVAISLANALSQLHKRELIHKDLKPQNVLVDTPTAQVWLIHNEAIAYEAAARFYAAHGFDKIADAYLREARYGYLRWEADGKVRQLDQLYPQLG